MLATWAQPTCFPLLTACVASCFAVLTAGSVAWLTISEGRKKVASLWYYYLLACFARTDRAKQGRNKQSNKQRAQEESIATSCVLAISALRSWEPLLLCTCSASLATSELKVTSNKLRPCLCYLRSSKYPSLATSCFAQKQEAIPSNKWIVMGTCFYCFAMLTTGSVASLTISVPRKKYVAQAIHCFARVGLRNKAKKSGASTWWPWPCEGSPSQSRAYHLVAILSSCVVRLLVTVHPTSNKRIGSPSTEVRSTDRAKQGRNKQSKDQQ